jgi:hypothetical protein
MKDPRAMKAAGAFIPMVREMIVVILPEQAL